MSINLCILVCNSDLQQNFSFARYNAFISNAQKQMHITSSRIYKLEYVHFRILLIVVLLVITHVTQKNYIVLYYEYNKCKQKKIISSKLSFFHINLKKREN